MKFDLRKPCKNCPFGIAETRIRFACQERAEEIEEIAYRQGFPCHLSAEFVEDDESGEYHFSQDGSTQHCAGAIGFDGQWLAWIEIKRRENDKESLDPVCHNPLDSFKMIAFSDLMEATPPV